MPAPTTPHRPRRTPQRQAVLQLLHRSDRFRSAQQLHLELRDVTQERVGLSTVYRILRALVKEKVAETQRAEDGGRSTGCGRWPSTAIICCAVGAAAPCVSPQMTLNAKPTAWHNN